MRWAILVLLFFGVLLYGAFNFIKGYPFRLYSNWIIDQEWNKYYSIPGYRTQWLTPEKRLEMPPFKEDYQQLWRQFPLRNSRLPLPVRHPLFQTVPILEIEDKNKAPLIGIIFLNPGGKEISRVNTLPVSLLRDHSLGQELFKLPFIRNKILRIPPAKLWQDIFSHKILPIRKPLNDMIYDLYLLHLRSKILPPGTVKYGLLNDDKAIVEINSKNKEFVIELVLDNNNGHIFSYVLKTELKNEVSLKLRSKLLESIVFSAEDPAMAKFLYTEFKQLNFARQVDQEGMLYLLSAWSQNHSDLEMFKEMVFYLERGKNTFTQLKPIYAFGMKYFGKTFSTRNVFTDNDDPNIVLQRKIELEKIEKSHEAQKEKGKSPVEPDLTPDEKMNLYLKKAKEESPVEKSDMVIH